MPRLTNVFRVELIWHCPGWGRPEPNPNVTFSLRLGYGSALDRPGARGLSPLIDLRIR